MALSGLLGVVAAAVSARKRRKPPGRRLFVHGRRPVHYEMMMIAPVRRAGPQATVVEVALTNAIEPCSRRDRQPAMSNRRSNTP
jgi:hypothetical protein